MVADKRFLNPEPARPLTSREIAKLLGSILCGLSGYCEVKNIVAAIEFTYHYREEYRKQFDALKQTLQAMDIGQKGSN